MLYKHASRFIWYNYSMCGRYALAEKPENLYKRYNIQKPDKKHSAIYQEILQLGPRYNIAPGDFVPVVTKGSPLTLQFMKWGLVPYWAKDPRIGYKMINARAETIMTKPSFKKSFRDKRCIIPATGFYEWEKTKERKIPYLFKLNSQKIFSFAGIYDMWKDAEEKELLTFTIITTDANECVKPIHTRMPVILDIHQELLWLSEDQATEQLTKLLRPHDDAAMQKHKVSTEVNNPTNDYEDLIY